MSFRPWAKGALPAGWVVTSLSDLVSARSGDSKLIKGRLHSQPASDLYPAFSASGQDVWHASFQYDEPGLVVSAVGARCGKTFLADGKWTAIANTHAVIPDPAAIDRRFLWFGINDEDFWVRSGTAQPFVVVSKSLSRSFALPPRAEQTRIVEKLEELLSDLDAGVAELKAAQKKLAQYRQSLLKAAVEGALTADWRAQHPPTETGAQLLDRILTERRARWQAKQLAKFKEQGKAPPRDWQKKYPEPVQPDTTDLPALPEGWVWANLDQLSEFVTSGSRGWAEYYSTQGATFIRSQDIKRDFLDLSDVAFVAPPVGAEGARTRVLRDDLLLTITGANVGKCAHVGVEVGEAYVSQHVALIRPVDRELSALLHVHLVCKAGGRGQLDQKAYGAGKPGLNLEQVVGVSVPLPCPEEIPVLLGRLRAALDGTTAQVDMTGQALRQSTAQRQNLLRAAFAGQLVPQDPSDEPASQLLERIRAERAKCNSRSSSRRTQRNVAPEASA